MVERVGERRVTGRDLGEKAAAEATNKEATRMIPSRCESASHVGELASGKALNLAKFSLGIFSRRSGGSAGYLLGEARLYPRSNNYCREGKRNVPTIGTPPALSQPHEVTQQP